jgi:threonine dehydrogenase-like Zn-dependent dehydrogenase
VSGAAATAAGERGTTTCAMTIVAPRTTRADSLPVPEPGPGEARIRIEGCGVCGSDLTQWEGRDWFDYPREPGAPGHEGWGVVDALGPGTAGPEPGTRVASLSVRSYADFDIAAADDLIPIPAELDGPFPGEPLGCAMNAFERSDIRAGQTVAVVGVGFLGALLVQLSAAAGARVIAISRRAFARQVGLDAGAVEALPLEGAAERVAELTGGAGCERVLECAGKQETLDLAGGMTAVRGRLVIAGFHQDGPRRVDMQAWNWNGLDVINAHERAPERYRSGVAAAVAACLEGRLDPRPLITHEFPLTDLGRALDAAVERPDGFLKAVVVA